MLNIMSEDWKNLKLLLAGCGSIGKRHARILTELGVKEITIFDPNAENANELTRELPNLKIADSYKTGLEMADAVFIMTPTRLHIPMAMQAIEAGCHVFIEKPISLTMDGIKELADLAESNNKKVMVGLCTRYHEGIRKSKHILDSGRIGRLVSVRSLVGEHFPSVHPQYKTMYYAKYSGAFELMHDLDLALWFANQEVEKVFSVYGSFSDIDIEAPDTVEFLLKFEDRCTATVHLDFFQIPRRRNMELIGTQGVLMIDFTSWDEYTISIYDAIAQQWEHQKGLTKRDDMFRDENLDFLESIVNNRPVFCDITEGCRSLRVIEAAQTKTEDINLIKNI
ncbi:MAG: Gfo/Idh/MocA family oxidoreductase [Cyclobacteriaceae bacterium]